jgi:hypothetical protein
MTATEARARLLLPRRSDGVCEICARGRATNIQHRKNRSAGGTWDLSNLLHVCGSGNASGCHGAIHLHPHRAVTFGWTVRSEDDPEGIPVMLTTDFGLQYVYLRGDGTTELASMEIDLPALLRGERRPTE